MQRRFASFQRNSGGVYQFPFGPVRYVDAPSLMSQFQEIFVEHAYEFECTEPTPLVVDCGGNIGMSVVWFKQRYSKCRVLVFEADPQVATVLQQNVDTLGLRDVRVICAAVSVLEGHVGFAVDGADGGRITEKRDPETISVPTVRLSNYINEPVELLKLDIEGAEFTTLLDLVTTGKISFVKRVACELHGRHSVGRDMGRMLEALARCGFRLAFQRGRSAPFLSGEAEPTPFSAVADGKFLMQLYAWRPELGKTA